MHQSLGSSSLPSVPSDVIVQARYRGARRRLFRLRDTLNSVTDSTSANDWITSFGKAMVRFLCACDVLPALTLSRISILPPAGRQVRLGMTRKLRCS
jgi:hypothetical protein